VVRQTLTTGSLRTGSRNKKSRANGSSPPRLPCIAFVHSSRAPEKVKELVKSLKTEFTEFIDTTDETIDLATEYITEKVVGPTSYADCLHIALATINRADFLVSWNFKHIVNVQRIRGYNAINIKNGYKQLEIRSPREFEKYEDD